MVGEIFPEQATSHIKARLPESLVIFMPGECPAKSHPGQQEETGEFSDS